MKGIPNITDVTAYRLVRRQMLSSRLTNPG